MNSSKVEIVALAICALSVGFAARGRTLEPTTLDVVVSDKGGAEARFVSNDGSSIGAAETFLDRQGACPSKAGPAKLHVAPQTPFGIFISVVVRLEDCPMYPITVDTGGNSTITFHRHTVEEFAQLEKQAAGFDVFQKQDDESKRRFPVLVIVRQDGTFVGTQHLTYLKPVTMRSIGGAIAEARAEPLSFRGPTIFMRCENGVSAARFLRVASALVGDGYDDLEFVVG